MSNVEKLSVALGCVDGFDQDEAAGESDDEGVVLGGFLTPQGDALEPFQLAHGLLDPRAGLVEDLGEEARLAAVRASVRDDGVDAAHAGCLSVARSIVALVGQSGAWRDVRADVEQDLELASVAGLPAGEVERERLAVEVALEVDLGAPAATRAAERLAVLPPLAPAAETCARTTVLSNICTRCADGLRPASAWKNASNTPLRLSREKRFHTLFQCPYPAGRARQVMLWTAKWCMASKKSRSSRPLSPRRERQPRNTSSTSAQSRSVIPVSMVALP